jgi:hypothetical protein
LGSTRAARKWFSRTHALEPAPASERGVADFAFEPVSTRIDWLGGWEKPIMIALLGNGASIS